VTLRVRDANPVHGDYAIIPLTGLCGQTPIGGVVQEFHIDNVDPKAPCGFTVTERVPPFDGDDNHGDKAILISWNDDFFDEMGFPERIARWRIYRGSSSSFVPSPANMLTETCIDEDPTTSMYEFRTSLPGNSSDKWYKMVGVDRAGNVSDTCVTQVQLQYTGVGETRAETDRVLLLQNMPNPFGRTTGIHYALPQSGNVNLTVFAVDGRVITSLVHGVQNAGAHQVTWDGTDAFGRSVPNGTYIYRLEYNGRRESRRMILAR
jgi:hypothetical protein